MLGYLPIFTFLFNLWSYLVSSWGKRGWTIGYSHLGLFIISHCLDYRTNVNNSFPLVCVGFRLGYSQVVTCMCACRCRCGGWMDFLKLPLPHLSPSLPGLLGFLGALVRRVSPNGVWGQPLREGYSWMLWSKGSSKTGILGDTGQDEGM